MIVRFIKHLVRITAARNSFYVAVGLSRLLHSYTTAETMGIYNLVLQDPERIKEDSHDRICKRELMSKLLQRFEGLIQKVRCARGEERFKSDDNSKGRIRLVKTCLKLFTPWDTDCAMPEEFDPDDDVLLTLEFDGENPEQEGQVDMRRIHAIIDPECYRRVARALRYDLPDERLSVPRFNLARAEINGGQRKGDRLNPP